MPLGSILFDSDMVVVGQPFPDPEAVIADLAGRLAARGCVGPGFLEAVKDRETRFPTGLPTQPVGVAIPHTDPEYCLRPGLAVAVLPQPVPWRAMGTEQDLVDVRVVFLLALPAQKHVNFLSQLVQLFQSPDALTQLISLSDPAAVADFVRCRVNLSLT